MGMSLERDTSYGICSDVTRLDAQCNRTLLSLPVSRLRICNFVPTILFRQFVKQLLLYSQPCPRTSLGHQQSCLDVCWINPRNESSRTPRTSTTASSPLPQRRRENSMASTVVLTLPRPITMASSPSWPPANPRVPSRLRSLRR